MDGATQNATLQIVTILANLIGVVTVGYLTYLTAKLKAQSAENLQITKDTNLLVNGDKGVQLYVNKLITERAAFHSDDPVDVQIADSAAAMLAAHESQKALVDESHRLEAGEEKPNEDSWSGPAR